MGGDGRWKGGRSHGILSFSLSLGESLQWLLCHHPTSHQPGPTVVLVPTEQPHPIASRYPEFCYPSSLRVDVDLTLANPWVASYPPDGLVSYSSTCVTSSLVYILSFKCAPVPSTSLHYNVPCIRLGTIYAQQIGTIIINYNTPSAFCHCLQIVAKSV